ncbi:hypothetical protein [Gemmobacter denitrificans]|uniref:Chitin binding peritrophin-A-like protein n=1 Tax=Gemmobacter denitrificans TaxID=3123040 RepID=A0ABU8BWZ4_9RHOB
MKTLRLSLLVALALTGPALAKGCHDRAEQAQISCAEGTQWNSETRSCQAVSS